MDKQLGKAVIAVISLLFVAVFIFKDDAISLQTQVRSKHFPSCSGHIHKVGILRKPDPRGKYPPSEMLELEYLYKVQDTTYTGTQYAFYKPAASPYQLTHLTSEFAVGQVVVVYYDAKDPRNSALANGVSVLFNEASIIGTLVIMAVLALIVYGFVWIVIRCIRNMNRLPQD